MDPSRCILHSDMNSYYASVEMMLDPSLKGKPVAVCGSTEDRHGIVLAKSDLAKKAGVRTGMVNFEARRLCPGLIMVPPQYDQYLKYTKLAHQIYSRYTDLVEPFGMDECWLDVTGSAIYGTPLEIAESIRQTVKDELGLTVSIGVSFNKIFAKLGSDMKSLMLSQRLEKKTFEIGYGHWMLVNYCMWVQQPGLSLQGMGSGVLVILPMPHQKHYNTCSASMA